MGTAFMLWLKANWGWVWRVAATLALLAVVWWAIGSVVSAFEDAAKLPEVEKALKSEVDCAKGSQCAERLAAQALRHAAITEKTNSGYEKEIADLRNRPIPTRVIRVCRERNTGAVRVPSGTSEPAGSDASGVVYGADEFDTRPLRELALKAEDINSGYRWLRSRDDALSKPPKEE